MKPASKTETERTDWPAISVVMPVRNEERFIEATIEQLLAQDYPADRYEVLVVDGMSTDATREKVEGLAARHPQLKLLSNPRHLSSAGRNIGFKAGQGEIFVVVDGHCHLEGIQLFKSIVRSFEASGASCLGRPQPLNPPNLTPFQRSVALARSSPVGHSRKSYIYSGMEGFVSPVSVGAVYKKEVFQAVGYVDERFDACEDVEFNYRVEKAGLKCYIHPSLVVHYYPRENLKGFFRQMRRYGEGRFKFLLTHPETLNFDMLIPPAFVAAAALLPLLALVFPSTAPAVLSLGLLYLLLLVEESLRLSLRHGLVHLLYIPMAIAVIHLGLGWGFLQGMGRGILAIRWQRLFWGRLKL
jgi:succinoglycan biosynthesis protein ExoA